MVTALATMTIYCREEESEVLKGRWCFSMYLYLRGGRPLEEYSIAESMYAGKFHVVAKVVDMKVTTGVVYPEVQFESCVSGGGVHSLETSSKKQS